MRKKLNDTFFRVEMLPALYGDALWIEYGAGDQKRRMLIDGGPIGAYGALEKKLKTLPEGNKRVELVVITHVDTDHIEGLIRLLGIRRSKWLLEPRAIWFNGWKHLQGSGVLGGKQGDFLSALIDQRDPASWNPQFNGKAVVADADGPPPVKILDDGFSRGMKLTLLSPFVEKLRKMADAWAKDVRGKHLPGDLEKALEQLFAVKKYHAEGVLGGQPETVQVLAGQLKIDQSVANGASIAFLAEFGGKSCLFLGDAHPDVICESLKKLIPSGQKRLKVDAVKIPHHGSRHNLSLDLMDLIDARHFLISTNGALFEHPDQEAIEAVIQSSLQKPVLWFNYQSEHNARWRTASLEGEGRYTARFPAGPDGGIIIDL
jgi:beta-lactamase superfamily II metal-dependent hydrolase